MFNKEYLDTLKEKYNYDDKVIRALLRIVPCIIDYYGEEYEELVLNAILSCEIIPCNSKQTISKLKKENSISLKNGVSEVASIEVKGSESSYISDIKISYKEENNKYVIEDIKRKIVTSHTYNYDSPKGLEVLTYGLIKLIKSYQNEFTIDENVLIKRTGLEIEKRQIIKDGEDIYLNLLSHEGHGLEEGLNIYDTSKVVSLSLLDDYKCYDYDSIYTIAKILKENFDLKDILNEAELTGNINSFKKVTEKDSFEEECDKCLLLENEMFIAITRDDKDDFASKINDELNKNIYEKLISMYEYLKTKKEKVSS